MLVVSDEITELDRENPDSLYRHIYNDAISYGAKIGLIRVFAEQRA